VTLVVLPVVSRNPALAVLTPQRKGFRRITPALLMPPKVDP
jgi:hypothetical protein